MISEKLGPRKMDLVQTEQKGVGRNIRKSGPGKNEGEKMRGLLLGGSGNLIQVVPLFLSVSPTILSYFP